MKTRFSHRVTSALHIESSRWFLSLSCVLLLVLAGRYGIFQIRNRDKNRTARFHTSMIRPTARKRERVGCVDDTVESTLIIRLLARSAYQAKTKQRESIESDHYVLSTLRVQMTNGSLITSRSPSNTKHCNQRERERERKNPTPVAQLTRYHRTSLISILILLFNLSGSPLLPFFAL